MLLSNVFTPQLHMIRCVKIEYPNKDLNQIMKVAIIHINKKKLTPLEVVFVNQKKLQLTKIEILNDYINQKEISEKL